MSQQRTPVRRFLAGAILVAAITTVVRLAGQSAPQAILLVTNTAAPNPFGPYLGEILRAEGTPGFASTDVASLDASTLAGARLVVLAETPLTAAQAALLGAYVAQGGRLVAMRPDPQLASSLGVVPLGGATDGGYLAIDTSTDTGAGFPQLTLPYHGAANHYSLAEGAAAVATLYSDRTTATPHPAVVRFGRTAVWTFDLARSVVYSRQGDPANAGVDRDGLPPLRSNDVFFNAIDLDRVHVPHADYQMRLFARVLTDLMADELPMPRLWYFPGAAPSLMVLTGDAHIHSQTPYSQIISSVEARSGRISLYLARFIPFPTPAEIHDWLMQGHDFGLHVYGSPDGLTLDQGFQSATNWYTGRGYGTPGRTTRNHMLEWEGWVGAAQVAAARGIGMDLSFYTWGPGVKYPDGRQAHGYINGSGLPMRFISEAGAIIPVYEQVTSLVDEQLLVGSFSENRTGVEALEVSRQLIDESLAGGYSAIATQFHVDYFAFPEVRTWAEGTMDYARSNGLPLWSADRWLRYVEARAATSMTNLAWDSAARQLQFTTTVPAGSERQWVALPSLHQGFVLTSATVDGLARTPVERVITGRPTSFVSVAQGAHLVTGTYGAAANVPPTAVADSATTSRNVPVALSVVANDTDPNGDSLSIVGVTQPREGVVTVDAGGSVTFSPAAGACGPDSFVYTVSDGRGGQSSATVSVNVVCADGAETHTSGSDFGSCSLPAGTILTGDGGQLRLAGVVGDEFASPSLDAATWVAGTWTGGSFAAAPGSGVLSLSGRDGAFVRSTAALTASTLEATVRFSAAPWEHLGWASLDFAGDKYLIFSTAAGASTLFARSNDGGGEQRTDLGPIPPGFHTYRIERAPLAGGQVVSYFVDGTLRAQHTLAAAPALHVYMSYNGGVSPALDIDRLWVYPAYVGAGTFQSCVMDAGRSITWTTASWSATIPSGTSLAIRTRTSNEGVNWSPWSGPLTISGQTIASPAGRYLQYLLELLTTNPNESPVLDSVTMAYSDSGAPNTPPSAADDVTTTRAGQSVLVHVLDNDTDLNSDPLSITAVTQGLKGTVSIGAGLVITTPVSGACGPDRFTYTVSDGRGGVATASVSLNILCASGAEIDMTAADFSSCSTLAGTIVTRVGDGEVRLAGVVGDEFAGSQLDPTRWVAGTWAGAAYSPTLAGGVLSLANQDGAFVRSADARTVTTMEATVRFTATPWQHVGWADLDFAADRYFVISTYNGSTNIFARSNDGTGERQTNLGAIPSGFRTYRIDRVGQTPATDLIRYFINGGLVAEHTVATAPPLYVYASHNGGPSPALEVERLWVYPDYVSQGTFDSCPIDAGREIVWTTASWSVQPVGAALGLRTRTSLSGATWTEWSSASTVSGGPIASSAGRYLQYRLEFQSPSPEQSAIVDSVVINFDEPNYVPVAHSDTAATSEQLPVTVAVLSNDTDANGDPLVVAAITQGAQGVVAIAPGAASIVYTPHAGACGSDQFSYTASDNRGGTASATVGVSVACGGAIVQTLESDFATACSIQSGTMVTRHGDGEVRLAGTFGDEYATSSLDATRWVAGTWSGGGAAPVSSGGVLSLSGPDGLYVRSANPLPVSTMEARVRFASAPWQHVGWSGLDFADSRYVIFSTFNGSANLYARSNDAGSEQRTDLGPIPAGFHTYRVERTLQSVTTDVVTYYVDGVLRAQHTLSSLPPLHVYQSYSGGSGATLDVDRVWVYPPLVGSGAYQSCPLDAGAPVAWMNAVWSAAVPAGGALGVRTRTSPDGVAWSGWSALLTASGQVIASPPARFLQYTIELSGSSPLESPVVESLAFIYPASAADLVSPVISMVASQPAPSSAAISWLTSEPSTGLVEYGASSDYGLFTPMDATLRAQHLMTIDGLAEGTTYHYRVVSHDAAGNLAASGDMTFKTPTTPSLVGEWGPVLDWPLVAVHAALMHTGEVVLWDAWELPGTPSGRIWNPQTGLFFSVPVPGSALFCAGHSMLADGRLLVIGGHHGAAVGIDDTNIFDPIARTWTRVANMGVARWYPTALTVPDGRVISFGGQLQPGLFADQHEIYDPTANSWTTIAGAQSNIGEYPRTYVAPDGRVFMVAGPDQQSRTLDLSTGLWTLLGQSPISSGATAMYASGKVMAAGGGTGGSAPVQRGTAVIDLNQAAPVWRPTAPMAHPRFEHNLVNLPDGKVVAVGGSSELSLVSKKGVLPAELWDPATEAWTTLAAMADPRMYHSVALLLPDGRVLAAGGGRSAPGVDYATAEIFSPPYLFKGLRPTIASAPGAAGYGAGFTVVTSDAADIASVSLVRLGSVTHSLNMDQRFVGLSFTRNGSDLTIQAPATANVAPPGYYMLFIVNSDGVPSVASMVRLENP